MSGQGGSGRGLGRVVPDRRQRRRGGGGRTGLEQPARRSAARVGGGGGRRDQVEEVQHLAVHVPGHGFDVGGQIGPGGIAGDLLGELLVPAPFLAAGLLAAPWRGAGRIVQPQGPGPGPGQRADGALLVEPGDLDGHGGVCHGPAEEQELEGIGDVAEHGRGGPAVQGAGAVAVGRGQGVLGIVRHAGIELPRGLVRPARPGAGGPLPEAGRGHAVEAGEHPGVLG